MISIETLAKNIEDELNANDRGLSFAVFADMGKYKEAVKTPTQKTRYTNCVLIVNSSAIVPTQGIMVAIQNATLKMLIYLPTPDTDEEIIAAHRAVLDSNFYGTNVQRISDNDKEYTVAITRSTAATGTAEFRDGVGMSLDITINIDYSYVENGLNSNDMEFTLDGTLIPYTVVRVSKSPTIEMNAYSDEMGKGANRSTAFLHNFDFEMPALTDNAVSNMVLKSLSDGTLDNTAHILSMKNSDDAEPKTYNVVFGNIEMNIEGIKNADLSFSLLERANLIGGN